MKRRVLVSPSSIVTQVQRYACISGFPQRTPDPCRKIVFFVSLSIIPLSSRIIHITHTHTYTHIHTHYICRKGDSVIVTWKEAGPDKRDPSKKNYVAVSVQKAYQSSRSSTPVEEMSKGEVTEVGVLNRSDENLK